MEVLSIKRVSPAASASSGGSLQYRWYALYLKPRQEDAVAMHLQRAGIRTISPKIGSGRQTRKRIHAKTPPLFPNYIFARFDFNLHYHLVRYTRGVINVVGGTGTPWPVADDIVEAIVSRMDDGGFVTLDYSDIRVGDRVEIAAGPLSGLKGIFEKEMKGKERVIVLLKSIGYQARVEIEKKSLKNEGSAFH